MALIPRPFTPANQYTQPQLNSIYPPGQGLVQPPVRNATINFQTPEAAQPPQASDPTPETTPEPEPKTLDEVLPDATALIRRNRPNTGESRANEPGYRGPVNQQPKSYDEMTDQEFLDAIVSDGARSLVGSSGIMGYGLGKFDDWSQVATANGRDWQDFDPPEGGFEDTDELRTWAERQGGERDPLTRATDWVSEQTSGIRNAMKQAVANVRGNGEAYRSRTAPTTETARQEAPARGSSSRNPHAAAGNAPQGGAQDNDNSYGGAGSFGGMMDNNYEAQDYF